MLKWAAQDPFSQKEIDRNNAVYARQKNRNPFIDHPEWVNMIWTSTPVSYTHLDVYKRQKVNRAFW